MQSKELSHILHDFEDFVKTFTVFSENAWVRSAVNRDLLTPNYRFWADHIHMIRLSNKSNLLNVRWRTTVQSKELSPILHDFEDLVKYSMFFWKLLGQKRSKSGFGHSKLCFCADHMHMIRLSKKKQLAKRQVDGQLCSPRSCRSYCMILKIWANIHGFLENAWVRSSVNRDSDNSKLLFLIRSHSYDPPVEKKATC